MRITRCIAAFAALLAFAAPAVQAQAFRTYLSLNGNDANPCTLQQPCRLLPAALAAVESGGEIWILDSANYNTGPVNIAKGVTILAVPGALGSVVALGGDAIHVTGDGVVTLRNLNIRPFPGNVAQNGVRADQGKVLIQDSNIFGFLYGGGVAVGGSADVSIARSVIRGNWTGVVVFEGGTVGIVDSLLDANSGRGVLLSPGGGKVTTATLTRSVARANGKAIVAEGFEDDSGLILQVSGSRIECSSFDATNGIVVSHAASSGTFADATISDTTIGRCSIGVQVSGPASVKAFLARNTIASNGTGILQQSAAIVESAGTNAVRNNGTNVGGTLTDVGSM